MSKIFKLLTAVYELSVVCAAMVIIFAFAVIALFGGTITVNGLFR